MRRRNPKHDYTGEQLTFLRRRYRHLEARDLTEEFNRKFGTNITVDAMRSTLARNKIYCGRRGHMKGRHAKLLNQEETDLLAKLYKSHTVSECTAIINDMFELELTEQQIKTFISNHGIKSERPNGFQKGHKPWNTGIKGSMKPNSGSFKKGNRPKNITPLGHERIDKDGYVWIKINQQNPHTGYKHRYVSKHRHVWEQAHGEIPPAHTIAFRDGNKTNCDLENLVLVSRQENLWLNRNGLGDLEDPDLFDTALAAAKVATTGFRLTKEMNE